MRVATYMQPVTASRGSMAAFAILILTIVLGTTVASTVTAHVAPNFSGLVTFVWMSVYVLAFLGLMFSHGINWISWLVRYRILLVLLLIGAIVSVSWAVDSRVSAERVVHLIGTSLIGVYLGFSVPLLRMLRVLACVLALIMIASLAAVLALPELGFTQYQGSLVWSGVFNSKNDLGFWSATGVLLYVTLSDSTRAIFPRLLCYLLVGLCLALLAFSHSATSLLALLIAGSLSLYLFIAARFRLGFVAMSVIAIMFAALVGVAITNIDTAELVGRTDDLTGRGEVWRQVWGLIMERPLTGYGYGVIWFPTKATLWIQQSLTDFSWIVYHAHNGFLQIASEIGLPLAILALLMVAQQLIEIFYCQYQRQQVGVLFVLAFVVLFLIGNFSEARFMVTRELYWILFIALPISMLRQINIVATEDERDDEAMRAAYLDDILGDGVDNRLALGFMGGAAMGGSDRAEMPATSSRPATDGAHDQRTDKHDVPHDDALSSHADIDLGADETVTDVAAPSESGRARVDAAWLDDTIDIGGLDTAVTAPAGDELEKDTEKPTSDEPSATHSVTDVPADQPPLATSGSDDTVARVPLRDADDADDADYDDVIRKDWYELPEDVTHDETLAKRQADADRFEKVFDETGDGTGTQGEWFDLSMDTGDETGDPSGR